MNNNDPRSPARQFADFLKIENIGAIQASEILRKAQIARLALQTCPPDKSYAAWLRKWIETDKLSTIEE